MSNTEENEVEGHREVTLSPEEQEAQDYETELALADKGNRATAFMTELRVSQLLIDTHIQRKLDLNRVNGIAGSYDPLAVGVLTASRREDGKYYLLDGQHRSAALVLLGKSDEQVQVKTFQGLTKPEEALLFRLLNNTKAPTPLDLFKVRILEGDPVSVKMFHLLTGYDWKFRPGIQDGNFMAVATLRRLFEINGDVAESTVTVLCEAWGNRTGTLHQTLLNGLGRLLLYRGDLVDLSHLKARLSKVPGGPQEVLNKANTIKVAMNMQLSDACATILVEIYNEGMRKNALEPWHKKNK